jgi:poly(3-hydroxybutyrate) depolymerase
VMLATYPDVFSGGAIMSGVPYGCATKMIEALVCMRARVSRTPKEWGDSVRGASQTQFWPVVSIWQGTADKIIDPVNADEEAEQWTNVHGTSLKASTSDRVHGYLHRTFFKSGKPVVEMFSIINMGHGQAVDPGSLAEQCGTTGTFFPQEQICAAYYASKFWGLLH